MKKFSFIFICTALLISPLITRAELGTFDDHTINTDISGTDYSGDNSDTGKENAKDIENLTPTEQLTAEEYDGVVTRIRNLHRCEEDREVLVWDTNDNDWDCQILSNNISPCTDSEKPFLQRKNEQWECINLSALGDQDWNIQTNTNRIDQMLPLSIGKDSPPSAMIDIDGSLTLSSESSISSSEITLEGDALNTQFRIGINPSTGEHASDSFLWRTGSRNNFKIGVDNAQHLRILSDGTMVWADTPLGYAIFTDDTGHLYHHSSANDCEHGNVLTWSDVKNQWICSDKTFGSNVPECTAPQIPHWDESLFAWTCKDYSSTGLPICNSNTPLIKWVNDTWACDPDKKGVLHWQDNPNQDGISPTNTEFVGIHSSQKSNIDGYDTTEANIKLRIGETPYNQNFYDQDGNIQTTEIDALFNSTNTHKKITIQDGHQTAKAVLTSLDEWGNAVWMPITTLLEEITIGDNDWTRTDDASLLMDEPQRTLILSENYATGCSNCPRLVVQEGSATTGLAQFGTDATASASGAFAAGSSAKATGTNTIAMGSSAQATNTNAIALGNNSTLASGEKSIAIGNGVTSSGESSIGIGNTVMATAKDTLSIGNTATASGLSATSIGNNTIASGQSSIAIGNTPQSTGSKSITIGNEPTAAGESSISIGNSSNTASGALNALAIGNEASATGKNAVAIGNYVTASSESSITIGNDVTASAKNAIAIGNDFENTNQDSVAFSVSSNEVPALLVVDPPEYTKELRNSFKSETYTVNEPPHVIINGNKTPLAREHNSADWTKDYSLVQDENLKLNVQGKMQILNIQTGSNKDPYLCVDEHNVLFESKTSCDMTPPQTKGYVCHNKQDDGSYKKEIQTTPCTKTKWLCAEQKDLKYTQSPLQIACGNQGSCCTSGTGSIAHSFSTQKSVLTEDCDQTMFDITPDTTLLSDFMVPTESFCTGTKTSCESTGKECIEWPFP